VASPPCLVTADDLNCDFPLKTVCMAIVAVSTGLSKASSCSEHAPLLDVEGGRRPPDYTPLRRRMLLATQSTMTGTTRMTTTCYPCHLQWCYLRWLRRGRLVRRRSIKQAPTPHSTPTYSTAVAADVSFTVF